MKNFSEFANEVCERVEEATGKAFEVKEAIKCNDVVLMGLRCTETPAGVPTPIVYLEPYYEKFLDGAEIEDIVTLILKAFNESTKSDKILNFSISQIMDWETIKNELSVRLVNKELNKQRLESAVWEPTCDDLAEYAVIRVKLGEGEGSITANKEMLAQWGKTVEEVLDKARENDVENDEPTIKNMMEELLELQGLLHDDTDADELLEAMGCGPKMIVVSNKAKTYGAKSILRKDVLEKVSGMFGGKNFAIIPSSVHEVICTDYLENNGDELSSMINSVNANEVAEEEWLSSHAYYFDRKSGEVKSFEAIEVAA